MFYSPVILESVTRNLDPLLQVALIYTGFLAGTLPRLKFGDWLPTRWGLVGTFAAMAAGLGGIACDPSAALLGMCFGLYALAYGMQSTLDYSLPNQLFPTAVRTTAAGSVLAMSCVALVSMSCFAALRGNKSEFPLAMFTNHSKIHIPFCRPPVYL